MHTYWPTVSAALKPYAHWTFCALAGSLPGNRRLLSAQGPVQRWSRRILQMSASSSSRRFDADANSSYSYDPNDPNSHSDGGDYGNHDAGHGSFRMQCVPDPESSNKDRMVPITISYAEPQCQGAVLKKEVIPSGCSSTSENSENFSCTGSMPGIPEWANYRIRYTLDDSDPMGPDAIEWGFKEMPLVLYKEKVYHISAVSSAPQMNPGGTLLVIDLRWETLGLPGMKTMDQYDILNVVPAGQTIDPFHEGLTSPFACTLALAHELFLGCPRP